MAFSFYALDNEFAVATGGNVNYAPGLSRFDYPPTSSKDLVVTTKDGDTDPRHFELGDVYEVQFGGNGGATLTDAVVIRSDAAPGSGGVIVFEGTDENGDLAQVVWSPGFDLETWYFNNFSGGNSPGFYTSDQNAAYSHEFVCFAAETRIATPQGQRRIDRLVPGDMVLTQDAGPQPVLWSGRRRVPGLGAMCPVTCAPGALGNSRHLRLSPQHRVLVSGPQVALHFGWDEVLVPVKALIDGQAIRRSPCSIVTYVHIRLAAHHLVRAEGAACETLLTGDAAARVLLTADEPFSVPPMRSARPILTVREGTVLRKDAPCRTMPALPAAQRGTSVEIGL